MQILNIQNSQKLLSELHNRKRSYSPDNKILTRNNNSQPAFKGNITAKNYRANFAVNFKGLTDNAFRKANYPEDHKYRTALAEKTGCKPDDLMCVLGPAEFKDIVSGLTPKNFHSDGRKNTNPDFKVTLHMHTKHSDGISTVEQMLDMAVAYANKMKNPPFIFALTDHDALSQDREALRLIAQNPEKFKNLRFVPGIEMTSVYKNDSCFKVPVYVEFLGYCVDPFDKELRTFLAKRKKQNLDILSKATERASRHFGMDLTLKGYYHPHFKLIISSGFKNYLASKGIEKDKILEFLDQNQDLFVGHSLTKATPELKDITKVFNTGILGMSHPGRTELKDIDLKPGMTRKDAVTELLTDVHDQGVTAAEANYQYHLNQKHAKKDPDIKSIYKHISDTCDKLGLLRTGGIDAHGDTIFDRE